MSNSQASVGKTNRLSVLTKLGYGAGGYGAALFYNNFCFYALYFYTDYVHINTLVASLIISVGAVWDAITDPMVGYWSDKRDPKKGRRRPFLLWFCIPLALCNWLAFTNPGFGSTGTILFFCVTVVGAYLFQTLVDIPFSSLGAEITSDYKERGSLAAYRNVFWLISIVISSYFLAIVDFCADTFAGGDMTAGYSYASLLCSIPIIITLLVAYRATKGKELTEVREVAQKFSWKHQVTEPMKNKPFRYIVIIYLLSIIAQAVTNTCGLYFFTYCAKMDEASIANYLVYAALVGFVGIIIANVLCARSKKLAWAINMTSWAISSVLVLFFWQENVSIPFMAVVGFLYGIGIQTQYQLIWSMIPDCIEVDEFVHGKRREGLFNGVANMVQKVGAALGIAILGGVLAAVGYDGAAESLSDFTLTAIRYIFTLGVIIPLMLSVFVNHLNPMTKHRHNAIVEALRLRKEGKEVNTAEFEALL